MALPNFLIIGAQKAGSSWLATQLQQHPEVFIPNQEVHFFDKCFNFDKGLNWYENWFEGATEYQAIGEKTPDYLWANGSGVEGHSPDVHKRIYNTLPDAKLIIILRNPVRRAISAVKHIIRSGRISPWHDINDLLVGNKQHLVQGHGVIDYGRYYQQIEAYLEYFHRDKILILIFEEDIVQNPLKGLEKVCLFLDINSEFAFRGIKDKINEFNISPIQLALNYYLPIAKPLTSKIGKYIPGSKSFEVSQETLNILYNTYQSQNNSLFQFLGREIHTWIS